MASRVAVIGAGPGGLAQLHAFAEAGKNGAELPELVCFEKQSDWGGMWNYTWRTGVDEAGDPVHASMYRHLWSNGPKECLEFADYTFDEHFGKPIPSYPPREVLYDYLLGRARKNDIRKYIQFGTAVRWVSHNAEKNTFNVTVEDLKTGDHRTEEFDYVIVSTGHFSVPNMPDFPGFEQFPGRILHSHDFRDSREFAGQDLLIIGSSYSAEDLALQVKKYGANSVTISYRTAPMGFAWPEGITEVPLLTRLDGNTAHFADGSSRRVDTILLCTGYRHHFPFLENSLRLRTKNVLYPDNLYKGVFWVDNPNLMYLAMQDLYYTFTLFDAQAWYARDYVLGRVNLPSADQMREEIASWRAREEALSSMMEAVEFQADHLRDLLQNLDYPKFDVDMTVEHFRTWLGHKQEDITGYRNRGGFASPVTGTVSPALHTSWWEMLDDSPEAFLGESAGSAK
ncbi:flavin-containing monooxygenase [Saccharomonospora viridis]|jgi:trimethylamine monooxygenase|uniref:Trimethylamine monooxygenase n=1 Tax=Saccharomonospora viridis (strain ATCC 15386 / DSM 43017 / JCM 3036 / CCUG 5913 / NBRC 12207 / NCIMB 9602 / P101) TaxID=471857 RepID=C7MXV6_SACVD|nr:NAD(P)/FAD-dependent oxidoreductase [Saccharomonospora viridis]ACU98034.1 predicted flavoprotein involved in K+ transport [Saccharomonospora viridis DSM 43017]